MSNNKIVDMDDYRPLEEIVKNRTGASHVVIGAVLPDGSFHTYIPVDLVDIDLVYLIQTLKDRRTARLQ